MKKLMIAAAAAAMIGGVEAKVAKYDFNAYLTTTTGCLSEKTTTETWTDVKLGKDAAGTIWYNDATFKGIAYDATKGWAIKDTTTYPNFDIEKGYDGFGNEIPKLVLKNQKVNAAEKTILDNLAATYKYQSGGQWCVELSYVTENTAFAQCYRVSGCDEIYQDLYVDSAKCCTVGFQGFATDKNFTAYAIEYATLTGFGTDTCFINRFGSAKADEANQVEIYAKISNVLTTQSTLAFKGWLAGQGWIDQFGENDKGVSSINGSIVGYTAPSKCINCCGPDATTIAFECNSAAATTPNTAAYGTFYIQIVDSDVK